MELKTKHEQRRVISIRRMCTSLIAITAVLWPYMFSIASTGTTFTLSNRTRNYLHANINNQTFVYIAPGGSVIMNVTAPTSVYARVRYSPGQSIKGEGERTVDITETTTESQVTNNCYGDHEGNGCNTTEPTSTTTASAGRWDVVPTDLTVQ